MINQKKIFMEENLNNENILVTGINKKILMVLLMQIQKSKIKNAQIYLKN